MRSTCAIFFLSILLFNWFGYRAVIGVLESQVNSDLEAQFDANHFDESQLVSIKVPVRYLPYYSNSVEYQRVDGQIEVGGIQYKYVKRRIYQDSLELLCIPNHAAMRLRTAANEFFQFSYDLTHEKKPGDVPHGRKHLTVDNYTIQGNTRLTTPSRLLLSTPVCLVASLPLDRSDAEYRPPERA